MLLTQMDVAAWGLKRPLSQDKGRAILELGDSGLDHKFEQESLTHILLMIRMVQGVS